MSETTEEYLVRLPQSICEDADEAQSALAAGMVDGEGHSTVPLVYLTDEMCERASRVFKWVLESDELATPPTPDRAAVREALVRVLENCPPHFVGRLGDHLATKRDWTYEAIADALLAAVSRPAEARGYEEAITRLGAFLVGKLTQEQWGEIAPLVEDVARAADSLVRRAHPAPSGGEVDVDSDEFRDNCALQVICRAFDNWEPIYERWLAYDKTQWLWWGRALGAFLRREIAAAPRPETGEVSEAMVEAAIAEYCSHVGDSYASLMGNASDADKAEMRDDWRHILRAALAAQRGAP